MSIINFHTNSDFNNSLYELLKRLEAPTEKAILVGGNVTIGLGFDLNTGGPTIRNAVFSALGLKVNDSNGTPAQIAAEQNYIAQLNAAIDARDLATLNDIMAARADDAILDGFADNRNASFEFMDRNGNGSTDDEIRAAFDQALPYYQGLVSQKLFGSTTAWQTYQDAQGVPFATSSEFEALLSLAWN